MDFSWGTMEVCWGTMEVCWVTMRFDQGLSATRSVQNAESAMDWQTKKIIKMRSVFRKAVFADAVLFMQNKCIHSCPPIEPSICPPVLLSAISNPRRCSLPVASLGCPLLSY